MIAPAEILTEAPRNIPLADAAALPLVGLTAWVGTGELRVEVARRVALAELPALHAQAGAGELSGKTVVLVPAA
ncbi:hypothetical protein [Micromonospora matsumotoense]|uniref:hypothetical protein n=1 Tax=Micromonospora matsumotoense TaxID=121616 RepID=UPI0033C74387